MAYGAHCTGDALLNLSTYHGLVLTSSHIPHSFLHLHHLHLTPSWLAAPPSCCSQQIYQLYLNQQNSKIGLKTGWESLDYYYRVVPGELTVVTGE